MRVEIPKPEALEHQVFDTDNVKSVASIALDLYHFQFHNNILYSDYCRALNRTPEKVNSVNEIPFLPISFFKTHRVETGSFDPVIVFQSSGTTGSTSSRHFVKDTDLYRKSFLTAFEQFYGPVQDYAILALLPSYLEKGGSSLVYMVEELIRQSHHTESGFYLHDLESLDRHLTELEKRKQKTIFLGVTYALLDFGNRFPRRFQNTILMETGGMKGRGKEVTRGELYDELRKLFGVHEVHSEYGMTELLSQAYGRNGMFETPSWMKVFLREETDPFMMLQPNGRPVTGAINIMDLANIYSCCFIATEDIGRLHPDGRFEVLGRLDHSDIRGCSQLAL